MAWGDKIDQFNIKHGETVEVSVDLESRAYNGRWYTDVKAWKVSKEGEDAYRNTTYDEQDDIKTGMKVPRPSTMTLFHFK